MQDLKQDTSKIDENIERMDDVAKLGCLIQEGDVDGVAKFLEISQPPNRGFQHYDFAERTREYDTFATLAVKAKSLPIVDILMEYNYDFVESDAGDNSPLHLAYCQGSTEIFDRILQYAVKTGNSNIIDATNYSKATVLILAARRGDRQTVSSLLAAGATASFTCNAHWSDPAETAHDAAVRCGHGELAALLRPA